ncbi:myb transcription factor [Planoprotostelium fungivorum]|uniref:Myb transcription factor n=1 Tax=Planoprotostelium fungivorum TaxID=1890364 RepID=A0A2P6NDJ1_9EUKA|nr:myb transcription factor [Planoprotostelium fungivorum]
MSSESTNTNERQATEEPMTLEVIREGMNQDDPSEMMDKDSIYNNPTQATQQSSEYMQDPQVMVIEDQDLEVQTERKIAEERLKYSLCLNLAFQQSHLSKIKSSVQRNESIKKKLRSLLAASSKYIRTKQVAPPGSQFVDQDGNVPPMNEDARTKAERTANMPTSLKPKVWSVKEIERLKKSIREQNKKNEANDIITRMEQAGGVSDFKQYKMEMERIRNISDEDLEKDVERIKWDHIAQEIPGKNELECQHRWMNVDSPYINRAAWTKEEDVQLLSLVSEYGGYHWQAVANNISEGKERKRTPAACFIRYQRSLNKNTLRSDWDSAEDEILRAAVEEHGDKNWCTVAEALEGRNGQQCLHRWQKVLNPTIRKGKWTPDEDVRLKAAVEEYGIKNWAQVRLHVPGRTDLQCRERWSNILDPDLKFDTWTEEEDTKLAESVEKHGVGRWSMVAVDLHPRTDNQCWRRWKTLNTEESKVHVKKVARGKKALVGHFVGRENERPTLTADDFSDAEEDSEDGANRLSMEEWEKYDTPESADAEAGENKRTRGKTPKKGKRKIAEENEENKSGRKTKKAREEDSEDWENEEEYHLVNLTRLYVPLRESANEQEKEKEQNTTGIRVRREAKRTTSEEEQMRLRRKKEEQPVEQYPLIPVSPQSSLALKRVMDVIADAPPLKEVPSFVDTPQFRKLSEYFNSLFFHTALTYVISSGGGHKEGNGAESETQAEGEKEDNLGANLLFQLHHS